MNLLKQRILRSHTETDNWSASFTGLPGRTKRQFQHKIILVFLTLGKCLWRKTARPPPPRPMIRLDAPASETGKYTNNLQTDMFLL